MRLLSDNRMPLVTEELRFRLVCWNEEEVAIESPGGGTVTKYSYDYVRVPRNADRACIIEAVIRSRYSQSQMEAIVNNYLRSDRTEEQEQEFNTMQAWRTEARDVATRVLAGE